mgnify:CR=1 FL=1
MRVWPAWSAPESMRTLSKEQGVRARTRRCLITIGLWIGALTIAPVSVCAEELQTDPEQSVRDRVNESQGGPPELHRQVREQFKEFDRASEYKPKLRKRSRTVHLSMDNLEIPFEVEATEGYLGSITFLDANGTPFPVRVSRIGDPQRFSVCSGTGGDCQVDEESKDLAHILTLGTNRLAGRTNLKVFFSGLFKPVQIPIVAKTQSYHDDITVMLPVENPDREAAKTQPISNTHTPQTDDYYARALIDRIDASDVPGAKPIQITAQNMVGDPVPGGHHSGYFAEGSTYVKTTLRRPTPSPVAVTGGVLNDVVYKFDGQRRAVTGFSQSGEAITLVLNPPGNELGYRELSK